MNTDQLGNAVYLVILGSVIAVWYFLNNRKSLNKTLQYGALWGLIFLGAIAAAGLWEDIRRTTTQQQSVNAETGTITVPRARDGHYYLTLRINDEPVRFVVDTGATDMVLTRTDAQAVGLNLAETDFLGKARTANGTVRVAYVTLDNVTLGPVTDRNVPASINDGEMDTSLLGMSYLQRFSKFEISLGELVLTR